MLPERFNHLMSFFGPVIQKKHFHSRPVISAGKRLAICLCYLATSDSQQSQCFGFRISRSTVCKIIQETCKAIWSTLCDDYILESSFKSLWLG